MSRVDRILEDPKGESRTMSTDVEKLAFAFMDYKQDMERRLQDMAEHYNKELANLHKRLDGMGNE